MACTTILVGKKASYDGSTMIARNDDSGSTSPRKSSLSFSRRSTRLFTSRSSLM